MKKLQSIHELEPFVDLLDERSLVIFDIDDVLIVGKDQALKTPYKQKMIYEKMESQHTSDQAHFFTSIIYTSYAVKLVDPKVVEIIKGLQQKKIKTIALTSGYAGKVAKIEKVEDQRLERLSSFGIDFSWSFPREPERSVYDVSFGAKIPLFKKGILFSCMISKEKVLKGFLEQVNFKPSSILFVDDQLSHLLEVKSYCKTINIPFIGCHYTAVAIQALSKPLNKEIVELQFRILEKEHVWLSDEAAEQRMKMIGIL